MRYESFYPFAHNQLPPQQQGSEIQPYSAPMQFPMNQQPTSQLNSFHGPGPIQPMQGSIPGQAQDPNQPTQGGIPGQGPSKVEAYMQTAQQFMNTAQQFAPVVQQFAPMMKNLPAMWRLYKGFQSLPSGGEQPTGGNFGQGVARASRQSVASNLGPQQSAPRIFQPPGR